MLSALPSLILKESIHVLACDSTWRRLGKIEAGKPYENSIEVANSHLYLYLFIFISFDACVWCHQYKFQWWRSRLQRCDMLLDWLEQRLEYTQRKRLRRLISNLTELVYVNALFALIMLIMLSPFIVLFLSGEHPAGPIGNCYAPPDGCQ